MDKIINDCAKDPVLRFLTSVCTRGVACLGPLGDIRWSCRVQGMAFRPPTRGYGPSRRVVLRHLARHHDGDLYRGKPSGNGLQMFPFTNLHLRSHVVVDTIRPSYLVIYDLLGAAGCSWIQISGGEVRNMSCETEV